MAKIKSEKINQALVHLEYAKCSVNAIYDSIPYTGKEADEVANRVDDICIELDSIEELLNKINRVARCTTKKR
jgi:hypothetical protein